MLILLVCTAVPTLAAGQGLVGARAARLAALQPQPSVATVDSVHLDNGADSATLTFGMSASVTPTAFVLADPDRVIVDLPQVDVTVAPDAGKLTRRGRSAKKTSLVSSYRMGLLAPGRSRIVIDLGAPAKVVRTTVRRVGDKSQLVVELAKTDRASFRAATQHQAETSLASAARDVPEPAPGRATIVLDPGHGGIDTGAVGGQRRIVEKHDRHSTSPRGPGGQA